MGRWVREKRINNKEQRTVIYILHKGTKRKKTQILCKMAKENMHYSFLTRKTLKIISIYKYFY